MERGYKGSRTDLTQEDVKRLLRYDPGTGIFTWRVNMRPRGKAGSRAGWVTHRVKISINGRAFYAHRLAWLYMTGKWPEFEIDHINGDGIDNRWINLREATSSQNLANRSARGGRVGLKGVQWREDMGKFLAYCGARGRKKKYLGAFDTVEQAHAAYLAAAKEEYGEFARG